MQKYKEKNDMTVKKNILIATLVLFILLAVLALGTLDYRISVGMVNKTSFFGNLFKRIGELPVVFGIFYACQVYL